MSQVKKSIFIPLFMFIPTFKVRDNRVLTIFLNFPSYTKAAANCPMELVRNAKCKKKKKEIDLINLLKSYSRILYLKEIMSFCGIIRSTTVRA